MPYLSRNKAWFAISLLALVGGLAFIFFSKNHVIRFSADGHIDARTEDAYWEGRVKKIGGMDAYKEFADAVENLSPREQHVAAHVFGGALYKVEGLSEGVAVCDNQFSMGCFHALFGNAAEEMGPEAFLSEMQNACSGRSRGMELLCLHGVGHGILGSLGYDVNDLNDALNLCSRVPDGGNITTGCWGGAYMEYNVRTLISLDSPERPLTSENQYEPCSALPDSYRPSCMFWQPTWWHVALSRTLSADDVFKMMGAMCVAYGDENGVRACIRGIGFRATWTTGYSASDIAHLCSLVGDIRERLVCWQQAELDLNPIQVREAAPSVCEGLGDSAKAECRKAF